MRFCFCFFVFGNTQQISSFKYFGHSDWEVRIEKMKEESSNLLHQESFAKINCMWHGAR